MNYDAAYDITKKEARVAFLYRDYKGNIVQAAAKKLKCSNPLALTLKEAISYTTNKNLNKATIESDSKMVIQALQSALEEVQWDIRAIVEDSQQMM